MTQSFLLRLTSPRALPVRAGSESALFGRLGWGPRSCPPCPSPRKEAAARWGDELGGGLSGLGWPALLPGTALGASRLRCLEQKRDWPPLTGAAWQIVWKPLVLGYSGATELCSPPPADLFDKRRKASLHRRDALLEGGKPFGGGAAVRVGRRRGFPELGRWAWPILVFPRNAAAPPAPTLPGEGWATPS